MSKSGKLLPIWERYIAKEIGVEFKACLYFFCILFYYSMYKVIDGVYVARILHMAEMIVLTYVMGYAQLYFMENFDEGDKLRIKECIYIMICTFIYTGVSYLFKWFDRNVIVSIGFVAYMVLVYICAYLVYKSKRKIDEKLLNNDLKAFKERRIDDECSRD